jgi:predicted nucleic acid-binding protein
VIVLDSSFLCAWHNDRDVHHAEAREVMGRFVAGEWGKGLLLEYVFLEVVTVLLARRGHQAAVEAAERLLSATELELVPCSEIFLDVLDAFRNQLGRALSFTDAALVTVARRLETPTIATFDRGLAVAGIEMVPSHSEVHEGPAQRPAGRPRGIGAYGSGRTDVSSRAEELLAEGSARKHARKRRR